MVWPLLTRAIRLLRQLRSGRWPHVGRLAPVLGDFGAVDEPHAKKECQRLGDDFYCVLEDAQAVVHLI